MLNRIKYRTSKKSNNFNAFIKSNFEFLIMRLAYFISILCDLTHKLL